MRKRRNREFFESGINNNVTYLQYYNRLKEMCLSEFEWLNMPRSVDPRYLEIQLFENGQAVFFADDLGDFLALRCMPQSGFDVYGVPNKRLAYGYNGYQKQLSSKDSVVIYNNLIRTSCKTDCERYAKRLYNIDRTIDVNINSQKTPVLIVCDENERLTMKNLYMQWQGNEPVIYGNKSLNTNGVQVLKTDSPFLAEQLYRVKSQYWAERCQAIGVNYLGEKRERRISGELDISQDSTLATRFSKIQARKQACRQINEMFGLNIDVRYRGENMQTEGGEFIE